MTLCKFQGKVNTLILIITANADTDTALLGKELEVWLRITVKEPCLKRNDRGHA